MSKNKCLSAETEINALLQTGRPPAAILNPLTPYEKNMVQWERNNGCHSEKSSRQGVMKGSSPKTMATPPY